MNMRHPMDIQNPDSIAAHPVPDRHGTNLFSTDVQFEPLLQLYLPEKVYAHLQPYLTRMGALAGGPLDELALIADKHPPTLEHRSRTGKDAQRIIKHPAYIEMERVAYGEFALATMSHRDGALGWQGRLPPLAKYALT